MRGALGVGRWAFGIAFLLSPLCLCVSSVAGGKIASPDTYQLRLENAQFGRIEISLDGGKRYHLIGRVTEPATQTIAVRGTNERGTVWKSGKDGLTLLTTTGRGLFLKTQGASKKGKKLPGLPSVEPSAIHTNLVAGGGILGELAPTPGSPVALLNSRGNAEPFSEQYKPHTGDVLLVRATLADEKGNVRNGETLTESIEKLEATYSAGAVARARANGWRIISGSLTLKAALPAHEPDPITFVTFLIDGEEVSTSNNAPFNLEWETRSASNGEHIVEVKAYNKEYRLLTQTRLILVVKNEPEKK